MRASGVQRYILAHWRGEQTLARSFLVNGLVAYIVLVFGLVGLGEVFIAPAFFYASILILAAWAVWATVGIVRCALRVYNEPSTPRTNQRLRRAFAVLALLITAAFILGSLNDLRLLFR